MTGVSFVVPVRDGEAWLQQCLERVLAQADGRPLQVIAVDDGSRDGSRAILERLAGAGQLELLDGAGRGAAAALNQGVRAARHEVVCQVDQDVLLEPGWMAALVQALEADPSAAAAQGWYLTPKDAGVLARISGLDLEERYARIAGDALDQVCTGNSAYRKSALLAVGLFDEALGYGYDNDLSYRLLAAGKHLVFCRGARAVHRWREGLAAWSRQQYGVGYGRLDVVARHPGRAGGDRVSSWRMIAHVPLTLLGLLAGLAGGALAALGAHSTWAFAIAGGALAVPAAERLWAGARAAALFGQRAALLFPLVHLWRDVVWVWALVRWTTDRLAGRPPSPSASMGRP